MWLLFISWFLCFSLPCDRVSGPHIKMLAYDSSYFYPNLYLWNTHTDECATPLSQKENFHVLIYSFWTGVHHRTGNKGSLEVHVYTLYSLVQYIFERHSPLTHNFLFLSPNPCFSHHQLSYTLFFSPYFILLHFPIL